MQNKVEIEKDMTEGVTSLKIKYCLMYQCSRICISEAISCVFSGYKTVFWVFLYARMYTGVDINKTHVTVDPMIQFKVCNMIMLACFLSFGFTEETICFN